MIKVWGLEPFLLPSNFLPFVQVDTCIRQGTSIDEPWKFQAFLNSKHNLANENSPWVLVTQWIERPPGVHEVMGSIPVEDSFFLSHARVMTIISSLSHLSPSLEFTIIYSIYQN